MTQKYIKKLYIEHFNVFAYMFLFYQILPELRPIKKTI